MTNFFLGLLSLLMAAGIVWMSGPGIWADLNSDRDALERAPEYAVSKAECKTKAFVLGSCDLEFTHRTTGEELRRNFMVFGDFAGDEVYALKSPDGYVTSNVGLDAIWNRMMMFGLILLLFAGGGLALLAKAVRGS